MINRASLSLLPTHPLTPSAFLTATHPIRLGTSRFLKTVRALHQDGPLVVKVFYKADPSVSLKPHIRRIKVEREALLGCPNVLPYARVLETERAGYLIRQYGASNLYDRISTRPFLSGVEKKWVAFQLLMGLAAARERGVRSLPFFL